MMCPVNMSGLHDLSCSNKCFKLPALVCHVVVAKIIYVCH